MPLPDEIKKKIANLSSQNKHDDIVNYLKPKLENGDILPQDVYEYVKRNFWPKNPEQPYVVNAVAINKLGVVVSRLPDDKKLLAAQFYLLAAERDSAWGCGNYALCALLGTKGSEKSTKTALEYAKKAVELTKNPTEKNQHSYIYAKALKANGDYSLSFTVITDYLGFWATQPKNQDDNLKNAVSFCNELIDTFLTDFQEGNFDHVLAKKLFQAPLLALQSIISCPGNHQELLTIRNKACLLAGKYYEFLNEHSKAWLAYCQAKDKSSPFYKDVVIARKELLNSFIEKKFDELIASITVGNMAPNENANPEPESSKEDRGYNLIAQWNTFFAKFFQILE